MRARAAALARHADRLARALAHVINILDPDCIVLGGGLSNMAHLYREVPPRWRAHVFSDAVTTPLLPARHGDSSGVLARRGCGTRQGLAKALKWGRSRGGRASGPAWGCRAMMAGIRPGLLYGAHVFLAGAVLGTIRDLALAPSIGSLAAALVEAAVMVAVLIWLAARFAARFLPADGGRDPRAGMALTGVVVVLLAELALGAVFAATGLAAGRSAAGGGEAVIGLAPCRAGSRRHPTGPG